MTRVAILLSGRGSNMRALVEQARGYEVVLVASDNPDAPGLAWAEERGLRAIGFPPPTRKDKAQYEAALDRALRDAGAEVIALAGYMRLLSPGFVARWRGRIVNIHPSLLPRHKGLDTHARALAAGDAEAGCSVHLVTEDLDAGRVLAQARVAIRPDDTAETLAARVLVAEHALYPPTLSEFCMTPTDRIRAVALQLPEAEERDGGFVVDGTRFAWMAGDRAVVIREGDGAEKRIELVDDVDWGLVEDWVAHAWELAAPQRLLQTGGQ